MAASAGDAAASGADKSPAIESTGPALSLPRLVAVLAAAQGLAASAFFLVITLTGALGALVRESGGWPVLPVAAVIVGKTLAIPLTPVVVRWRGRRFAFLLGAALGFVGGLSLAAGVHLSHVWLVCVGCAAVGGFDGVASFFRYVVADAAPAAQRGRLMSLVLLGPLAAALIGPGAATVAYRGWPQHALLAAACGCVALAALGALVLSFYSERREGAKVQAHATRLSRAEWQALCADAGFIRAALVMALGMATMSLLMNGAPLAAQVCGIGLALTAASLQAHIVGMFAPSLAAGWLMDRWGPTLLARCGFLALLAASALALAAPLKEVMLLALLVSGVGWNLAFLGGTGLVVQAKRRHRPAAAEAVAETGTYLANVVAAVCAGMVASASGWPWLCGLAVGLALLGLLATRR